MQHPIRSAAAKMVQRTFFSDVGYENSQERSRKPGLHSTRPRPTEQALSIFLPQLLLQEGFVNTLQWFELSKRIHRSKHQIRIKLLPISFACIFIKDSFQKLPLRENLHVRKKLPLNHNSLTKSPLNLRIHSLTFSLNLRALCISFGFFLKRKQRQRRNNA